MADKKTMKELLEELTPKVAKELDTCMNNDPNSMRNILKRMNNKEA